ncbi:MAG: rhodanese-like domain-containing protein [Anaerolineales bacterium]|nr:rhodanese-like domain-containing protein [Anaerolineales bacterium]MDW8279342.1 rhodanese-like domain-containing protein [Anaerolineales bacterium]
MTRKLHFLFALLTLLSLVLSACGAPAVATQEPVVAPPTEVPPTPVPPTPTPEPAPDAQALFAELVASLPADKGYGTVQAVKLNEELAEKPLFLLDVREAAEAEKDGYLKGAVNIPVRQLLDNLDKLPGLDEPIVIYCASGHRGGVAMAALKLLGYTNVRNLAGGLNAWKKASLPVESGKPAEAASLSKPIVADKPLYDMLKGFFAEMPDDYYAIKADKLNEALAEKAPVLLDVRTAAEFEKDGHLADALNIPLQELFKSVEKLPAKDTPIVIYCVSGHRGSIAMMGLRLMGYTNVRNLAGGLNAWKAAKLPVVGWVDWPSTYADFLTNLPADQGYYTITAAKLNELLADKPPFILDVREAAEVESTGYIAGTVNIPVREVLKNLDKLPAQDAKIVVACASGHRGAMVMMALRLLGYQDVVNLAGGINGWKKAELPLEPGKPAAAAPTGATPNVDKTRLTGLDAYLSALPEGFFTVKAPDLNAELGSGTKPFIVDVRTAEELTKDGYIEGALNIPINELPARLAELPKDKATPIVILCKSGHRGSLALVYLQSLGYTNVRNLAGGMNAWIAAELPVVKQ